MAYTKQTWANGDVITSEKLNHMEEGIENNQPSDAQVASAVTDWLDENVDPVGSAVVVDSTLSVSGAAADAKVTGDAVSELKSGLSNGLGYEYTTSDGYIASDGTISAASANGELYTSLIPVFNGMEIHFYLKQTKNRGNWCAYGQYDGNESFINRTVFSSNEWASEISYSFKIENSATKYISLTWRSYGDGKESITVSNIGDTLLLLNNNADELTARTLSNLFVKGINHRGFNTVAPENTIPAFKLSAKNGFKYVETDVRFTSNGIPVCLHDASINRTARNADGTNISSTINIHDITYEDALTYDFGLYKGSTYAGVTIPTFEDVLLLCRNLGLHLYIELKYDASYTEAQIKSLVDIVNQYAMSKNVSWISQYFYYLQYVSQKDSNARLGFVAEQIQDYQISNMNTLKANGNEIFINGTTVNTSADIAKCVNNGIGFEVWTVDTVSGITALNPYVSGVTSNVLNASKVLYEANIS